MLIGEDLRVNIDKNQIDESEYACLQKISTHIKTHSVPNNINYLQNW